VGECFKQQEISPIASREKQAYMYINTAVTGDMGTALNDIPHLNNYFKM